MEELFTRGSQDWEHFLAAMVLAMVRLSGVVAVAPFFSSQVIPRQAKALFVIVVAALLAPAIASLPSAHAVLGVMPVAGELCVGLLFGFCLGLWSEILLFAGQVLGGQFSFSLVNLLDPNSRIETPLMSQMLSLFGVMVLLTAGMDRTLLAAVMRSYVAVPLGAALIGGRTMLAVVPMMGGVFFASLQLAAPVLAATMLVEVAVALIGKMSPQLPVMAITVPAKTMMGYLLLLGSLALWPHMLEAHFVRFLDLAERILREGALQT
ncbi:flagellar biosynthetic protein FliR [Pseudacidobacterium ailaaui]|jgi:flagellar biosynthetic protein FliR|uniref:flagellar biosynthetic protein FliR n=1 Tax=Pseudacidobacterium ailaaui TaxID=1382359 RepID=UPI000479B13D|nr:flagellar biosynthetic protein FliR [Pseudacidobacterium ailaaui]